jgi:hypothetical protein
MDPFATAHPGAAFDAYEPVARERSARRTPWTPEDGPLSALYVSHGAPPLFDDADWMARLGAWADRLPTPRAILIVPAHWESAPLALSSPAGHPAGVRLRRLRLPRPSTGTCGACRGARCRWPEKGSRSVAAVGHARVSTDRSTVRGDAMAARYGRHEGAVAVTAW